MWCDGMMCDVKMFNVVWSSVKCKLNPTKYINTTALVMWNVAGTHTRTKPMAHNFTHTGKVIRVQRRKGGCWGQNQMILRKIYICYKVWCGMVCCVMWNVCGLDGLQSVKWCRMVWWRRAYGVKLRCGVECHGVILNVLWYGYVQRSEQFALPVIRSVQRNVSSVLFMCQ